LVNSAFPDYILPGEAHRLQAMLCRYVSQAAKRTIQENYAWVFGIIMVLFSIPPFFSGYKTPKKIIFLFFGG
jgi:hypothetical protein